MSYTRQNAHVPYNAHIPFHTFQTSAAYELHKAVGSMLENWDENELSVDIIFVVGVRVHLSLRDCVFGCPLGSHLARDGILRHTLARGRTLTGAPCSDGAHRAISAA